MEIMNLHVEVCHCSCKWYLGSSKQEWHPHQLRDSAVADEKLHWFISLSAQQKISPLPGWDISWLPNRVHLGLQGIQWDVNDLSKYLELEIKSSPHQSMNRKGEQMEKTRSRGLDIILTRKLSQLSAFHEHACSPCLTSPFILIPRSSICCNKKYLHKTFTNSFESYPRAKQDRRKLKHKPVDRDIYMTLATSDFLD